ncbi:hypothetical protein D3C72_1861030 [compost metagenome]
MQPVGPAQLLRRARRRDQAAIAVALDQVLDDGARFGDGVGAVRNHGRLAQRVDGLQRGGRQHGFRVALVALDLVVEAQFLEQPEHALRARIVQMVDDDHGFPVRRWLSSSVAGTAGSGRRKGICKKNCEKQYFQLITFQSSLILFCFQ